MEWTDIRLTVAKADADNAEAVATMIAEGGIYIEDYSDIEQQVAEIAHVDLIEQELLDKPRDTVIIHMYLEPGASPVETLALIAARMEAAGIAYTAETEGVEQEDWQNGWRKYYHPLEIGKRLAVVPSWQQYDTDRVKLILDPGLAFGTGGHETTSLCLEALDEQVRGGERIALIGDNGTGKSTLIKMLMEEEYPDEGKIKFGPSVRTAYLPQIVTFDVPERNLVDTMLYSKRNITPQTARDRLAAFHFTGEDVFKSVSVLSGGELCYDGVSDLEELLTRLHDEWERGQRERGTGFNPEGYVAVTEQGKPWDPNGLGRRVAAFVEENALPSISLHGLRHSFASVANSQNVPMFSISKALGHSSTSVTSAVYMHLFDDAVADVVSQVASAITGKEP